MSKVQSKIKNQAFDFSRQLVTGETQTLALVDGVS